MKSHLVEWGRINGEKHLVVLCIGSDMCSLSIFSNAKPILLQACVRGISGKVTQLMIHANIKAGETSKEILWWCVCES